ncbi:MAG TPA: helix-hairpin-helix domain-containing protein [Plantibacter sp.]|uniref:helix-hairpin-helix domain-containing protein n=1 Tax=unclassified Plantibacter TaxID=2624265 RepID=UPI002C3B0C2E|nr:helix-hairpin-helix domain-containing protein [Plantibacter sp.]
MSLDHEPADGAARSTSSITSRVGRRLPRSQFRAGAVVVLVISAMVVAVLVSLSGSGGTVQTIGGTELVGEDGPLEPAAPDDEGPTTAPRSTSAGNELYIHVLGAVAAPGLYRVPDGSRAFDAIAAAGGMSPDADPAGVNLARFVSDGEQLFVPLTGEPVAGADASGSPGQAADGAQLVNLNTATAAELASLPRIGEALAARIIAWRDANGRFTAVDDLSAVEGIGAKTLDGLRDSATV